MKKFRLSRRSKKRLEEVNSKLKLLITRVLDKSPHDFGIPRHGGKRTAEEQNSLYNQVPRVTWLDGYIKLSYHQSGNAFDIFIYDEHGACWKCEFKYHEVAEIFLKEFDLMKKEGIFSENEVLKWGGHWKRFKDLPHFELRTI